MNSKEILIVTRCFWPQTGLKELALSDLAMNLKAAGHKVTVATIRWSRTWSENIEYHGIPVVRFAKPVSGPWSSFRYGRLLSKHLATKTYDAVIVSGVGEEAAATIRCVDELTPVIIRIDARSGSAINSFNRKHVECCLGADAVVANSRIAANLLNRIDVMPKVHVVPDGIQVDLNQSERSVRKRQAREALSAAHPVLQIEPNQRMAVTYTPFESSSGLLELVQCWPTVLSRYPRAKLWLLGDGPESSIVWQHIARLDIAHSVVLPGYFDNLNDLFSAADLYIHPSPADGCSEGLFRAIASGLNFVSTQCDELNRFVELESHNRLSQTADWSRVILDQLMEPCLKDRIQLVASLQQKVCEHYSPKRQVASLLDLIESATVNQVAIAK